MPYDIRELIEAVRLTPPVYTFLNKTFFGADRTHMASKIELDIKKGKRKMAPFVSPRIGGKVMKRNGYRTDIFTTPLLAPETEITIDDLEKRLPGEHCYSTKTQKEREAELMAEDIIELRNSISRRKEWMCREILFNGKMDIVNMEEGIDIHVDFGFTNKYVMTADSFWTQPSANPKALLRKIREHIIKATGAAPNVLIFGSEVIDAFINHPSIEKELDKRCLENITWVPKIIDDSLICFGRIAELGLEIYGYYEYYLDDNEDTQPLVPENAALMAKATTANDTYRLGTMEYGLISQTEGFGEDEHFEFYEATEVPKIFFDNNVKKLRLSSRPLPRPHDVDSWAVIYPLGE